VAIGIGIVVAIVVIRFVTLRPVGGASDAGAATATSVPAETAS
jgi:hypothetical protein